MGDSTVGYTQRKLNVVKVGISVVLLLAIILPILRCTNNLPARFLPLESGRVNSQQTASQYCILFSNGQVIYYFDFTKRKIYSYFIAVKSHTPIESIYTINTVNKISVSPNKEKIAILAVDSSDRAGIYQLTTNAGSVAASPQQSNAGLDVLVRADQLESPYKINSITEIAWSPDSQNIAFSAVNEKDNTAELFACSVTDKKVTSMRSGCQSVNSIFWIDDRTIAFSGKRGSTEAIYTVKLDTSEFTSIN